MVENTVGKREIARYVFKRLVLQTRKNQGLFGKELIQIDKELAETRHNLQNANFKINWLQKILLTVDSMMF